MYNAHIALQEQPQYNPERQNPLAQREAYRKELRRFLRGTTFGDPKLLAVDDIRKEFGLGAPPESNPDIETKLGLAVLYYALQKEAEATALSTTVRARELTLPGYKAARDEFYDQDIHGRIFDAEYAIAKKNSGNADRDSLRALADQAAASNIKKVVDEILEANDPTTR